MSTILADETEGRLRHNGTNELQNDSKVEDPPAYRMGAPAGRSLGKFSGDRLLGENRHECVLIQLKLDERYPENAEAGEVWIGVQIPNQPGDAGMKHIASIRHDGVVFNVPANCTGASGQGDKLVSSNGKYVTVQQGDGNLVTYRALNGNLIFPLQAVWASGFSES